MNIDPVSFEKYIDDMLSRTNSTKLMIDGRAVKACKDALQEYQQKTTELYDKRNIFRKFLYFFGIGISQEERAQLRCIRKIRSLKSLAKLYTGNGSLHDSLTTFFKSEVKKALKASVDKEIASDKFQKMLKASFYPPTNASKAGLEEISGSSTFGPVIYFLEMLQKFSENSQLSQDDKDKIQKLIESFSFNKKIVWKAEKSRTGPYQDGIWYKPNAVATFYTKLDELDKDTSREICFTSSQFLQEEDNTVSGHAVLFSVRRHPEKEGIFLVREYNTGHGASISGSSMLNGFGKAIFGVFQGKKFSEVFQRSLKTEVVESEFSRNQLMSTDFESVLSDELFAFKTEDQIDSTDSNEILTQYNVFKEKNKIQTTKPISVDCQFFGNCGVAAPLAYIKDRMGEDLFGKFRSFVGDNLVK